MRHPFRLVGSLSTAVAVAALAALPFAFDPVGGAGLPVFFAFH